MDDNFSPRVKDVITYSKEEALRLGHDFIGTEHLMLGLLREGNGKAIDILNALEIDLNHLRRKVEILSPANPNATVTSNEKKNLHLTRQAERALKTTFLEAKLFQSTSINTAHLLLCILRNENDPTTKLLNKLKVDYDNVKVELARQLGIDAINPADGIDQVSYVQNATESIGADAVIITASNKSNEIISQSARMCRKRGRVVLVGVIGLDISRADFFEKEITFQVSCSYGPGRYDEDYEQKGQDYPIGFVRWTEKRNFEAVLNAISKKTIDVSSLITDRVPLNDYQKIYGDMSNSKSIASILEYSSSQEQKSTIKLIEKSFQGKKGVVGIIGAGNFTSSTILPNLKKINANIKYIASSGGLSSTIMAKKHSIANSTSDYHQILNDEDVDLVLVTTQHHMHAKMAIEAINAGKSVFVEKPLAMNQKELDQIIEAYNVNNVNITVGFNRRFAPLAKKMKKALITGVTGQDGSYLAEFLLDKGYEVHGIKRRASSFNTQRVDHIYEDPHVDNRNFVLHYGDLSDSSSLTRIIQEVQPNEFYNLGAQSHVGVRFETPEE